MGPGRGPFTHEAADVLREIRPAVVSFHFGLPSPELLARMRTWGAKILRVFEFAAGSYGYVECLLLGAVNDPCWPVCGARRPVDPTASVLALAGATDS